MSRRRNRDNINERFMSFTPVMFRTGHVIHAITLYAPKHTACGKRGRMRVHFAQEIDCIDCLASLFYKVPVKKMKRWLDRNKLRAPVSVVKAAGRKANR
jgi:hypothetical protein